MDITRSLHSRFDEIPGFISETLHALNQEQPLSEEDAFHIKLALEEALTNAVKHGNRLDPALVVQAAVRSSGGQVTIDIRNEGPGFDPDSIPDPTREESLMKTSGRGVYLIRKIMDDVQFTDHGRRIRMVKRLSPPPKT